MKKTASTEGLIRTLRLDGPPTTEFATAVIDYAIMLQSRKRIFAPEARMTAITAMLAEQDTESQLDVVTAALTDHSLPLEMYCSER